MKSYSKRNIVLYCVIAVVFIASICAGNLISNAENKSTIVGIFKNGELVKTIDLSDDDFSSRTHFDIGTSETGINSVRVKLNTIWVTNSDCPNKICVNGKRISYSSVYDSNFPIICVPNRLEIRIISGEKSEIDAIVR